MSELLVTEVQVPTRVARPPARRGWRPDFGLGYALLIPILFACCAGRNFLFDSPGYLDSNMYLGYFLHYADHLPLFENYYKISRLPWVLPGFAVYWLLGPFAASFVLPVATMAFGLMCLYLLLRDALDARTALVGVVLLGASRWFHGVGGWNYHMTIATCYYLLIVLCLGKAGASNKPRRWYFLAGAALSMTVHSFIFMAAFVPGLVVHYFLTCAPGGRKLRACLLSALVAVAGVAASTALLGAINKATGGRFDFILPQVQLVLSMAQDGNRWVKPASTWVPAATYLVLPTVALLSCPLTWWLGKRRTKEGSRSTVLAIAGFQVQLLWAVLVCCYYQFIKHQTTLDHAHFGVCLLGPSVLTLCGFIYAMRDGWSHWSPHWVFAVGLAAFAVPYLIAAHGSHVPRWIAPVVLPGILALAGLLCLALARRSPGAPGFVAGLLLLGLANTPPPKKNPCQDCFRFCIEADTFASRLDPTLLDIKYWYDTNETMQTLAGPRGTSQVFNSFVSTRGWLGNLLGGAPVPQIPEIDAKHLGNFSRIAVLSNTTAKHDHCRRMTDRFTELGMPLRFQAERDFRYGEIEVSMVVYEIQKNPGAPGRER